VSALAKGCIIASALMLSVFVISKADAHAVCGDRIFPATLGINDPGVGDELSVPTLTYLPSNGNDQQEFDVGAFSWTKTLFSPTVGTVGLTLSDGATVLHPGGSGWDPLSTELQWGDFCAPEHEAEVSFGVNVNWANTGTGSQTQPFNTYEPVIDFGKGFGDLPNSVGDERHPELHQFEWRFHDPIQPPLL
jgi:hypothetical protein